MELILYSLWRGLEIIVSEAKRRKRLTLEDFQVELPASEQEIAQALNDRRILTKVTPQPPSGPSRNDLFLTYLYKILELLLMHPVSHSPSFTLQPVLELSRSLEFEHEVGREVTLQVMRRFGQVDDADERWKMDVEKVVRQVGSGILRQ